MHYGNAGTHCQSLEIALYTMLKSKTLPENEISPRGVIIRYQAKGWTSEEFIANCIQIVCEQIVNCIHQPDALLSCKAMLILYAPAMYSGTISWNQSRKKTRRMDGAGLHPQREGKSATTTGRVP